MDCGVGIRSSANGALVRTVVRCSRSGCFCHTVCAALPPFRDLLAWEQADGPRCLNEAMTRKKRFLFASTLACASTIGCLSIWTLHWQSEEYAVYDAAIRETLSGDGVSYYVILDTTQPDGRFGIPNFHSKKLSLPLAVRASYTARNVFRFHILPEFDLPHPFRMVGLNELGRIHDSDNSKSLKVAQINELLRKSWGVITLSRVGFDLGGEHAVVYVQLTYCGLCGGGTYLYLSKESGTWCVVSQWGTWIS